MKTVYFIKPIGMDGPIKIGCSTQPVLRRQQLEAWSPFELEIIATIDGDHLLESRIHAALWQHQHRGEWFRASLPVLSMIADIQAGRFNPTDLPESMGTARLMKSRAAVYKPTDWEYLALYDQFRAIPWEKRKGPWPAAPCMFRKYSAARKQRELADLSARVKAASAPARKQKAA